jgi:hypothetical protein
MRAPRQLLRDLGWKRFFGVQTMLLATFSQFACAPLLWSFWLTLFGMTHPVSLTLGNGVVWSMVVLFVLSEMINLTISMCAVSDKSHRHLMGWVLSLPFYFPMGALAAYKGLYETVRRPFYWDKTEHGVSKARGRIEKAKSGRDSVSPKVLQKATPDYAKDIAVFRRYQEPAA